MRIRRLESRDREDLLALLDGGTLPASRRGGDCFRRFLDHDPSFEDRNVWVAEDAARLAGALQVFPRTVRLWGRGIPTGGIGGVFGAAWARGPGVATSLLERALRDLTERGFLLSLFFGGPHASLVARQGFSCWNRHTTILRLPAAKRRAPTDVSLCDFDRERDLRSVRSIHAVYDTERDGTVVRDAPAWEASLRLAGNPDERFRVARRGDRLTAYVRMACFEGAAVLTELGRTQDAAPDLAALVEDVLARVGHERAAATDMLHDPELAEALEERGAALERRPDPGLMLRVLDAEALGARMGLPLRAGERGEDLLRRIVPPGRLVFWPADRF